MMDNLTNHGMIDLMYHDLTRFKSVNRNAVNAFSLWQRWVRK